MSKLSNATRDKLKAVSTATVATALFKRGFRVQMIQDVHPLSADQPTLVGEAFTLRYMPAREDLNKIEVFRDRAHPQRKAVEDCPPGAVLVMDSRKDARAASGGAILVTRLMQRGVAGVVTDGGFRDSAEIAKLGFPAFHHRPSAPTNLTLHQAIEINVPIGCGDAPVFPGDVIFGDSDGVIVIPAHVRGFRRRAGPQGTLDIGALSCHRRADAGRFCGMAEGKGEVAVQFGPSSSRTSECSERDPGPITTGLSRLSGAG
jgi:regulator of RNase E activity RraA